MKRDQNEQDPQQLEKVRKTLRGRAEKACVRCRAKKRTCDGGQPCQRCKESHSACYFSDWHYTVPYPREYVEYLEEQQEQLSSGLMTMYRLLKESHITTIPPLPEKPQAQDLLAALRGLRLDKAAHSSASSTIHQHNHASGDIINFTNNPTTTQPESRPQDYMMQNGGAFDAASRSPTQPSMFMPSYPSIPVSGVGPPQQIPKTMPGSFVPLYSHGHHGPFDYTRPTPPMPQQGFSPTHASPPMFGQLQANSAETWQHDPSLSPTTASGMHMSPPQMERRSPRCSLAEDSGGGEHNHDPQNNHMLQNHHHHQHPPQNHWSWPPPSGAAGVAGGFYGNGNMAAPSTHDAHLAVDLESIEQAR